jgi:hypothetical protein
LDEIFAKIKAGKIRFPGKGDSDEQLRWLIDHCCSMETNTKTKDGVVIRTYQKGTVQNDGLMALMYAYVAYQFLATRGFSHLNKPEVNTSTELKPVLGFVPRLR